MSRRNVALILAGLSFSILLFSSVSAFAVVSAHQSISTWEGTTTCLSCHETEAQEVFSSVHYQWLGETPYMENGPSIQGKLDMGVNSYCINTTGNWNGCAACHTGLGARPEPVVSQQQLENIDCMICHQEDYKRVKIDGTYVPDSANMTVTMVEAAQTVHLPTRATCLQCHAKGGGGDNFKRGDMALAHAATSDSQFDVHMATTGANLDCQSCHVTEQHRMAGRGTDLRPTDLDIEMSCTDCHTTKASPSGHADSDIGRHVARVACQTCHIPSYAKNAADTAATEMTEMHRDWRLPHETASGAIHPTPTLAGDLIPNYAWWNGRSVSYTLYDDAVLDPGTGAIPTSRPLGTARQAEAKLYPFKYKTATQPLIDSENQLIALDTSVYFSTGDPVAAIESGLANMGYSPAESYSWVDTDTLQLITHEVAPSEGALSCSSCHDSTGRMDLQNELGYALKDARSSVCTQCHGNEGSKSGPEYEWVHKLHVEEKRYDCSWCHDLSRPERGLRLAPIIAALRDIISVLQVLVGNTDINTTNSQDADGDGVIGLDDGIRLIRDAANQ